MDILLLAISKRLPCHAQAGEPGGRTALLGTDRFSQCEEGPENVPGNVLDEDFNQLPWSIWDERIDAESTNVLLRANQIRAAIALYRNRTGKLPDRLDDLCPAFLPDVPLDPFDGKPLRYALTADGWKVWSIGVDLTDDGGTGKQDPIHIQFGKKPDIIFKSNIKSNLYMRSNKINIADLQL